MQILLDATDKRYFQFYNHLVGLGLNGEKTSVQCPFADHAAFIFISYCVEMASREKNRKFVFGIIMSDNTHAHSYRGEAISV